MMESSFSTLFRHWVRSHPMPSAAFELKQTKTNSLPFSAVKEHQIDALLAASRRGLLYKAPDDSRGKKPFDFFYLSCVYSYVVIKYDDLFCLIDIERFIKEEKRSKRRSLTKERACEIAAEVVKIRRKTRV